MTFLPVVARELRVGSRRRGTYWMRVGAALIALGIAGWVMLVMFREPPNELGFALFVAMAVLTFAYAFGSGLRITADCLSEEKREGTLGLLFLTDLRGYDVVFGKLIATSMNAFYAMVAVFPILAISLLLGGVTLTEFWRVALVAVNVLLLSLSTGLLASAICRDERRAMSLTFLTLLFLCAASPLLEAYWASRLHVKFNQTFLLPSPAFGCFAAFDAVFRGNAKAFWINQSITAGYTGLFLALASIIVPRSWQDKAAGARMLRWQQRYQAVAQGGADARVAFRRRLLAANPFYWLAGRDRTKPIVVWGFLLVVAGFWLWGYFKYPNDWLEIGNYVFTAICLHTAIKVWLAAEACRRFVEDRRTGAMELLLSTPLSVREIVKGQRLALFRQFGGAVAAVLVVDFVFLMLGLREQGYASPKDRMFWIWLMLAGMGMFVLDLITLASVSMWLGMTATRANRASGGAIGRILFLPWVVFGIFMTAIGMMMAFNQLGWMRHIDVTPGRVLFCWFAIGLANDLFFLRWSSRRLREQFRARATERFVGSRGVLDIFKRKARSGEAPPVLIP